MAPARTEWARGFHRQARSDWALMQRLRETDGVARCHPWHYLQMASEKIAKAYRLLIPNADEEELRSRHVGFERFIASVIESPAFAQRFRVRASQLQFIRRRLRAIAREIEGLAPAVDRGANPENVEYPWAVGDRVIAPCEYDFARMTVLREPHGVILLRIIDEAIREFPS